MFRFFHYVVYRSLRPFVSVCNKPGIILDGPLTVHEGISKGPQAESRQNTQADRQRLSALDRPGDRASGKYNGRK
jgi:hypothetical protein